MKPSHPFLNQAITPSSQYTKPSPPSSQYTKPSPPSSQYMKPSRPLPNEAIPPSLPPHPLCAAVPHAGHPRYRAVRAVEAGAVPQLPSRQGGGLRGPAVVCWHRATVVCKPHPNLLPQPTHSRPQQLVDLVARILAHVPPWVRIYRIQRDIPMPLVSSGVEKGNLRELALARMGHLG